MTDLVTKNSPVILSLISYAQSELTIQCIVLPILAKCIVYCPKQCMNFKEPLIKLSSNGLFSSSQRVSQECSRILALLHGVSLTESLSNQLHWILFSLYGQGELIVTYSKISHLIRLVS